MSSKSWYALRSKAVPTRYGLSKNIQTLLHNLDLYYSGSLDATELGRLVRLSPQRRAALANTITKCANIIKNEPTEVKTCVDIIEMCTEILEIADALDRRPPVEVFPFMKLPMEIRDKILDLMITNVFRTTVIVPANNKSTCSCPTIDRSALSYQTAQMKALPTLLGTVLNQEFCRIFFRKKTFRFRCTCELFLHLSKNTTFFENVRHIVVHWCGNENANAFKMLRKCPRLESLTISISKLTYAYLSSRAQLMRSYFPGSFRNVRFSDISGLDELLEIRGLKTIQVSHAQVKGNTSLTVEMERAGLSSLLSGRLTQPASEPQESV
ncbi:hypothetical protein TOPH_00437 [Tolypocladium ophioglossoides CBS 100239]|uniref:Uncharacterized protein n=1 Tax=Tolypocladium ophioglossoides (strain CBS 100239) TaxID=1163406 RepID=A0A0L0NMW8_TOLOC|nr:hypothetical protein TOPH_00437 [Tolypocladium ophioglossoides CBS 100239]